MPITIIAAVSKNGVIGAKNDLPWYIPEDLKHFKALTTGKVVLMGRKTFESILKRLGKPLPNRKNVVVTRDTTYAPPLTPPPQGGETGTISSPARGEVRRGGSDVEIYASIDEALNAHKDEDIMVIGGGEIFRQTIDRADRLEITEVDREVAGDVHFPQIDPQVWSEVAREKHEGFSFVTYERR